MERRFTKSSAAITTVSDPLATAIRSRYTQTTHVIPNGFDQDEFAPQNNASAQPQEHFEIVYTGHLYPPNHPAREGPRLVFEALDQLANEKKIKLADFRIRFVGTPKEKAIGHFTGLASEKQAVIDDWVPRNEIRDVQVNATVLLSLGSRHMQGILTGKIFDYLNSGRPILSIPDDGDGIGKLLKESGAGRTASNRDEVANCIYDWYQQWLQTRFLSKVPYSNTIEKFNWRNQTQRFADVLDQIVAQK